ncbi:MAG: cation:proton antiporter [Rhodospirillaceae bacterium TMED8]|nr:cation:proton antiporter [Magnetovibrio sp.]OUT49632.1 MAG: cation:proton antiporter [Rhodospirillaceae bacterium TMED8]|tara:strand:+ start:1697 stop:2140 length:444 start_codon:yes stop_codon:yes gene_type:complete
MKEKIILRVISKFLIPYILLFGLYVQWHGDFGPGGGFQAGVIFASGFILYGLIFGVSNVRTAVPSAATRILLPLGVLGYGLVGVMGIFKGGNFLDYNVLAAAPTGGQHLGIILIELGVGVTVATAMITIFSTFASRAELQKPRDEER